MTIALADLPNVMCGLDEYSDLDLYRVQFQEWVQIGLANQIDYDKSKALKYSRFGDMLGFYIWNATRLSKKVDKLQLEYHGTESQAEACDVVGLLEQAFQIWPHKSSSFLSYPNSKTESAGLLRNCNDEIWERLGEEKWARIVRHLGLPRERGAHLPTGWRRGKRTTR